MWMSLASGLIGSAYAAGDDYGKTGNEGTEPTEPLRVPDLDGKIPTPQQLLDVLDSMTGLSDEEKANLREELLRNVQETVSTAEASATGTDFTTQTIVLLSLLALVALIFVFFIYKLFKCLSEREKRREEKKRSKQLKKKK